MFVCTHCSSKCYVCACLFLKKRFLQKLEHMHSLPHIPIKGNLWINLLCLCRAGVGNKNYHLKKKKHFTATGFYSLTYSFSRFWELKCSIPHVTSDHDDNIDRWWLLFPDACTDHYNARRQATAHGLHAIHLHLSEICGEWPFPLQISIFNKTLYCLKWNQRWVHINTSPKHFTSGLKYWCCCSHTSLFSAVQGENVC